MKAFVRRIVPLPLRNKIRVAFRCHPFEYRARWPELSLIALRKNDVVLDVGGNNGEFAECVLAYQPWAVIHSFEPIPHVYETMRRKLIDYSHVYTLNFAIGSREGRQLLNISQFDQASSFLEQGKLLTESVYGIDFSIDRSLSVPVYRLDSYVSEHAIGAVRLLKIDVQGYELEVLKGAEQILSNVEWIYIEAQFQELYKGAPLFEDIFEFLVNRGFDLKYMVAFRLDDHGNLMECDMILRNSKSAPRTR